MNQQQPRWQAHTNLGWPCGVFWHALTPQEQAEIMAEYPADRLIGPYTSFRWSRI